MAVGCLSIGRLDRSDSTVASEIKHVSLGDYCSSVQIMIMAFRQYLSFGGRLRRWLRDGRWSRLRVNESKAEKGSGRMAGSRDAERQSPDKAQLWNGSGPDIIISFQPGVRQDCNLQFLEANLVKTEERSSKDD